MNDISDRINEAIEGMQSHGIDFSHGDWCVVIHPALAPKLTGRLTDKWHFCSKTGKELEIIQDPRLRPGAVTIVDASLALYKEGINGEWKTLRDWWNDERRKGR